MSYIIVLTVGPVQSYISQARRTHDLFQGSRILSYLAGKGLDEAETYTDTVDIIYPMRDEKTISDIYASIPNRLLLEFNGTEEQAIACATTIKEAIEVAWYKISENTRNHFLKYVADGEHQTVNDIWQEQEANWLECYWTVSEFNDSISYGENVRRANRAMGARKLTRDFAQINEIGTKDSITGEHAVLVGNPSRTGEKEFWTRIREKQSNRALISSSERLGAISTTKRLAHEEAAGNTDLEIKYRYPSTSSIATAGFKYDVLEALTNPEKKSDDLAEAVQQFIDALLACYLVGRNNNRNSRYAQDLFFSKGDYYNPEYFPPIWALPDMNLEEAMQTQVTSNVDNASYKIQFMCVDGDYLYDDTLITKTILEYLPSDNVDMKRLEPSVRNAQAALSNLVGAAKTLDIMPPHPYLAILSMDGDKMGDALRDIDKKEEHKRFSQSLRNFASSHVERIVEDEHLGRLVYAGGDDVLALVPIRDALDVAETLRKRFTEMIYIDDKYLTASTGIAYVHHTHNLQSAISSANSAQKDVAKKEAGRNAIAISLLRRSGEPREMASKWQNREGESVIPIIEGLTTYFRQGILGRSLPAEIERINYQMDGGLNIVPAEARTAEIRRIIHRRMNPIDVENFDFLQAESEIVYMVEWIQNYTPNMLQTQRWIELARFIAQKEGDR